MRQSSHRYLLPPALLIVHSLLLLPILIPYKPDNSPYPESSLQIALKSTRYALPLACVAFAIVSGVRILSRSRVFSPLGGRTSWATHFSLGILEEVVQWGLARYLSGLEGGGDGYGAKNPRPEHGVSLAPEDDGFFSSMSVEVEPGIWEGVYLMGWMWSALECIYIWWTLAPHSHLEYPNSADIEEHPAVSRPQSYHSWRKEHAKKRSTDSTIRTIRGLSRKTDNPFNDSPSDIINTNDNIIWRGISHKSEDRASSPELSRTIVREEDNDAEDEETSATDNENDGLDSPLTPTIYRPAHHTPVPTQASRPTADGDDDQEESTPTQQKHDSRFLMPGSVTSDSDYFGRREPNWTFNNQLSPRRQTPDFNRRLNSLIGDSETESLISGTQTPLLSSSIPLDQEQISLLGHPYISGYGSTQQVQTPLGNLPHPPLDLNVNNPYAGSRPSITSHPSYLSITTGDEAEDESDTQGKGVSFGRAYPSHPAFSSSYIHQHFPSPGLSNTTYGQLTPTITPVRLSRPKLPTSQILPIKRSKAKRPRSFPGIVLQNTPRIESPRSLVNGYRIYFNGINTNSVPLILVVFWVMAVSFQHIGYGLWYVWFPSPIFEDAVQWWSIIFFVGVSCSKGLWLAETSSGCIVANGLSWITIAGCTVASFVLYFIALVLWGVLW